MLIFFDESFRNSISDTGASLGALCGIAIPEKEMGHVSEDVYRIKKRHFGAEFAKEMEINSYYDDNDRFISGIKVIQSRKEKTPGDPKARGRDK